eukprot:snap_masked-scaffold_14-processed-gene-2.25-mRNA-1 protein AED:1.00 eAED:1.00 QI:0/0/0/0/1/1/2/0/70
MLLSELMSVVHVPLLVDKYLGRLNVVGSLHTTKPFKLVFFDQPTYSRKCKTTRKKNLGYISLESPLISSR